MSKMSELATALDDLTDIGLRLMACGESLIHAAARVKECFSDSDEEAQPREPVKEPKPAAEPQSREPVKDPKTAEEAPEPKTYMKEEVRALLAGLSQSGFRNEAKALVRKYSDGGSLTDIDPARYPELMEEAQKYHA